MVRYPNQCPTGQKLIVTFCTPGARSGVWIVRMNLRRNECYCFGSCRRIYINLAKWFFACRYIKKFSCGEGKPSFLQCTLILLNSFQMSRFWGIGVLTYPLPLLLSIDAPYTSHPFCSTTNDSRYLFLLWLTKSALQRYGGIGYSVSTIANLSLELNYTATERMSGILCSVQTQRCENHCE